mmetsp:Transcript_4395/g.5081  ORF Transcript_4395/g.5081 Transcript_4395/m.5081 type:complete len:371 (-) Transcript_4395:389-1501(-)|eukprot:CAMPEP_0194149114 /NCGR_PEP_ID=MMETSP0152-20130528/36304_1 /TAXON_ID=1049557 /ORGANISM="Thalassiothrix antarctica, Strain L6-D1" /LENGTH=370 /DNA_ID=CAMNT_0038851079 /DNA_START=184 /DNA_END=1296 /DNA_ORIENTATION=-
MSPPDSNFESGQLVIVEPRTWAGINRPGGVGRISEVDLCPFGYVETVSVKYVVGGGHDTKIDLQFVRNHDEFLTRTSRSRRGRSFYKASPANGSLTYQKHRTKYNSSKKVKNERSQNFSFPISPLCEEKQEEVLTMTKTSTSKAKATLLTSQLGAMSNKKEVISKPPVPVIFLNQTMDCISPLAMPLAVSNTFVHQNNQSTPKVKENQHSIVKRLTLSSLSPTKSKNAERARKKAKYICAQLDLVRKTSNISAARIPLKQVFDNDMEKAQIFVNNLVGNSEKSTKGNLSTKGLDISSANDQRRETIFRKHLGRLFQCNDDCTPHATFVKSCLSNNKNPSVLVSKDHVEIFLQSLCDQGKIMISDNEIYKI